MLIGDTVWGSIGREIKWSDKNCEDFPILISGKICILLCNKQVGNKTQS